MNAPTILWREAPYERRPLVWNFNEPDPDAAVAVAADPEPLAEDSD